MTHNSDSQFKNQFLIALSNLEGDYFAQSISLIVDHNEDGAFALMINRPIDTDLAELFPDHRLSMDTQRFPVLEGGPVEQDCGFFIHRGPKTYEGSFEIFSDLYLTTATELLDDLDNANGPDQVLTFLGYAGWGPGQLEEELAENVWLLAPADPAVLFETPFEDKACRAAASIGVDLNLFGRSAGHG